MSGLFAVWAVLKKIDWRIIAAILIAVFAALALHRWAQNLKEAGRVEVRQQWAEAQRRADLKQLALVADQQQKINAADAALVNAMMDHASKLTDLETALADERAKNAKPSAHGAAAIPACDAIPEGVRNALNSIGRTKH
jgi:uncharacterized membrane protein YvbJ